MSSMTDFQLVKDVKWNKNNKFIWLESYRMSEFWLFGIRPCNGATERN
jgi:hypothetical protein